MEEIHKYHDNDSFADTGTSKKADLASFAVGKDQINDLDTSDKGFFLAGLVSQRRSFAVNGPIFIHLEGTTLVNARSWGEKGTSWQIMQ